MLLFSVYIHVGFVNIYLRIKEPLNPIPSLVFHIVRCVSYLTFIIKNTVTCLTVGSFSNKNGKTVVSNSIKISRNLKLLYIRNGFQIRIPRPKYACAENFKFIRQRERPNSYFLFSPSQSKEISVKIFEG